MRAPKEANHKPSATAPRRPGAQGFQSSELQRILLELATAAAHCGNADQVIALFCEKTRALLGASAAYFWELQAQSMVVTSSAGDRARDAIGDTLHVREPGLATEALQRRCAVFVNLPDSRLCTWETRVGALSAIATPVTSAGTIRGVLTFTHSTDGNFFDDSHLAIVELLAAQLGSLLEQVRLLRSTDQHRRRAEDLMSLALQLGSSLRLPDFVRSFTARAAQILGARAAVLTLAQGGLLEVVVLHAPEGEPKRNLVRALNHKLNELSKDLPPLTPLTSASQLLGAEIANGLGWSDITILRLMSASGDLLGLLCLGDRSQSGEEGDDHVLHAVAGQAAMALDNCRLFSRIAQANQHWMEIFDAMDDLIVVHDEENRVLRVNRTFAESIGARPAELIGISMRALVNYASARSGQACPFCRGAGEAAGDYIHPVLERTYLVSTSRIHGVLDEGLQTIHVLKDISERREVERRYRELFDNIQEGLFFSTPEGRFVEVNDAFVRMLGYESREELLQAEISSQIYFSPDGRQRFMAALEKEGVVRNFEESLRRKDGTLIHTLQNTFAVRDAAGKILQYRGLILDITEQKRFQSQLLRERDFNSKVLNNTQSLILVVDTAGLVSFANRRCFEVGGYEPNELLGHRLSEFVHAAKLAELEQAMEATLDGNQVNNLELPITRRDGSVGQFSVNLSPMRDEQGTVSSIVAVMTDITEAAQLEAKLRHTEKMAAIGQLVSGVAHEVNNPLTAILGFADLLSEDPAVPEAARKDLEVIVHEAQRTKFIVQNLLSFARKMPAKRELVQVNDIIRRTLQLRAYDFASHNVEISENLQPHLPEVMADPHQLQQVVLNILNNAYDAVRDQGGPGRIVVTSLAAEGCNEITFTDNGKGITYPERIFDPFFTTKEVGKGTGLGLSICYGILREHGGEVTCRNNEGSPGATFIVRLPHAAAVEAEAFAATAGGES